MASLFLRYHMQQFFISYAVIQFLEIKDQQISQMLMGHNETFYFHFPGNGL